MEYSLYSFIAITFILNYHYPLLLEPSVVFFLLLSIYCCRCRLFKNKTINLSLSFKIRSPFPVQSMWSLVFINHRIISCPLHPLLTYIVTYICQKKKSQNPCTNTSIKINLLWKLTMFIFAGVFAFILFWGGFGGFFFLVFHSNIFFQLKYFEMKKRSLSKLI